jgi:hypothetical protein
MWRRRAALAAAALVVGLVVAGAPALHHAKPAYATSPPESTFFSTAGTEQFSSVSTNSNGDLWANCWSNDDNVYAANGDGPGFGSVNADVVVNRISGTPGSLSGAELASGAQVGQVWGDPATYNRKPTGMLCVNGTLYLAVQDLNYKTFDDAPNATIAKSTDHGQTWTWNTSAPMFSNHQFTTIWFLDYGKDNAGDPDPNYVYAYGLDGNWRTSYAGSVPNPVDVYLARVPKTSVQDAGTWQWSTGANTWSAPGAMSQRVSVLHDDRVIYPTVYDSHQHNLTTLAQGSVVYDAPLGRYLYTSWTEYTFEFYEAPNPWGPWSHFMTKDFGGYPWTSTKNGGYATTIPSKFISSDGRSMWVQSNVCSCGGGGYSNYDFTLRRLTLVPYASSTPGNARDPNNNLATAPGTVPIERTLHFGNESFFNDGVRNQTDDDWNDEQKPQSWYGYTWPRAYNLNQVLYTTGNMFSDGGWFSSGLTVQVRQNFNWVNVSGLRSTPAYPYNSSAGPNHTYELDFNDTWGDGVRIIGATGGTKTFTSIAELEAYYAGPNLIQDPGFEGQTSGTISAPWSVEGADTKGIDINKGFAHWGLNNAWIHPTNTATTAWNSIKQTVAVSPNTTYTLTGYEINSGNFSGGYFGVRDGSTTTVLKEVNFGASGGGYQKLVVTFSSGSDTSVTFYAGYWAPGADSWLRLDDVSLEV